MHILNTFPLWINSECNIWPACKKKSMVHVDGLRNLYANEFGLGLV